MQNSRLKRLGKILNIIEFSLIFGVILLFIVICAKSKKDEYIHGEYAYYRDGWSLILENGDLLPLEGKTAPEEYQYEEYSFAHDIDAMSVDSNFYILSKNSLKVYVDGELRYEKLSYDSPLHIKPVKSVYHSIQLYREDIGKQLVVTLCDDHYANNKVSEVIVGDSLQIFKVLFAEGGLSLVLSIILLIVSVVILISNFILNIKYKNRIQAYALGLGIFMVALWVIVDNFTFQFVFGLAVVEGFTGYLITMLLPIPFMYHLNKMQNYRYSKVHYVIQLVLLINFCTFTCLNFFSEYTFRDNLLYIDLVVGIALVGLITTLGIDIVKKRADAYRDIAIGYIGLIICSMLEMVVINVHLPFKMSDGICIIIGMYFLQAMTVISVLREMSQAYLKASEAIHASQQKSNFLANMSHEIRTPINAVLGLDKMILRESKETEIRRYAADIQSAGNTLLSLINDILDVSKIESGKMELVCGEYDVASIISDVVNMIRPKVDDKQLELVVDVAESVPCKLYGDEVRIKQILVNLLTNAVKYTHQGSVKLAIRAENAGDDAHVTFSVEDSGIGIKPEDIEKLSEKFVRIEEARNKNIEGTGLGMNIVISLLQLMGSKIEVDSVYGKGSKFYFTISQPIRSEKLVGNLSEQLMHTAEVEEYAVPFCIPDGRILVVDDNAMNRNVFKHLLKEMQCTIDEAESGIQCLELVKKEKYDIIFMDHMMPEMSGVETFRRMKEVGDYCNADTPVIILTANAISGAREEYIAEGFWDYLTKPIDVDKLEKMIGEIIPEEKKKEAPEKRENEKTIVEDLPYIDGVDWITAIHNLESKELLLEIIEDMSAEAAAEMQSLKDMYAAIKGEPKEGNYSAYRIQVHSMKSCAATIGASHVAGLAKYLEYAARDMDAETIENIMPLFEKEWDRLKQLLDKAFG